MREINLTKKEQQELRLLHRKNRDKIIIDKIKAILMLDSGYSRVEIAKILLINEDSVTTWKQNYLQRKNDEEWLNDLRVSNSNKLTPEQEQEISDYVGKNIISDCKAIQEFIKIKFNKKYSASGIQKLLHRLNFVYKQTTLIPSKYDEKQQEKFKQKYKRLLKQLKSTEAVLFMDGVHPQHNTVQARAWIKKGQEKLIKSNTGRSRVNINGAYNPLTQEVLVRDFETINAESIIRHFQEIEVYYKEKNKIHVIVDNARYYRNKLVALYLKKSKIKLIFLPPYSPNLNLIERLWKLVRKKVINNKYYEKPAAFRNAILGFLNNTRYIRPEIKKFIGTELHLFNYP